MAQNKVYETAVIGGGLYGCLTALNFSQNKESVIIFEKEKDLLTKASYNNQARVHNGYHYPRSYITALRSAKNFQRFSKDFSNSIFKDFKKIYAISRHNSKVNAKQFELFCKSVGIPLKNADPDIKALFNKDLVEAVYATEEHVFNAKILRDIVKNQLKETRVEVKYQSAVNLIERAKNGLLALTLANQPSPILAKRVFVACYSGINKLLNQSSIPTLPLKHELTELALVDVPKELKDYGITLMDGPFFSLLPFPDQNLYTFTHVRYTPHFSWSDTKNEQTRTLKENLEEEKSNVIFMKKDAQRYLPILKNLNYNHSLYETKTVLLSNEQNDGRPILFKKDYYLPNLNIMLGGKIDNIYDILDFLKVDSLKAVLA